MKKVVVIGGGTGTFSVLSGIKHYNDLDIKAIVTVTDSGGSTGRLRDEYGVLPVGDIRQCLVALAESENGDNLLRKLFLYRFDRGDLEGHNVGNLFLTAMTDILGSEDRAIEYASRVLNIRGAVIPITNKDIDLVAEYQDGTVLVGEAQIDDPNEKHNSHSRITGLKVQPRARISPKARQAITSADMLILGPGDLYTSLLSNVVVGGAKSAFMSSKGIFVYILNIMTKLGQTTDYTASEHLSEIISYTGREPDYLLINTTKIPHSILKRYETESARPVVDDIDSSYKGTVIRGTFLSHKAIAHVKGDPLKRSLLRHDSKKLARTIYKIISNQKRQT
jgi:uncharacterized cofD-like protein